MPLALPGRPRQPQAGGDEARLGQVVAAEHQVLGHRLGGRQRDVLEGPGHADAGDLEGAHLVQPVLAEAHLALGGLVDAGQDVEHRRLAGAVGPDDRVDRARLDGERHLGQRLDGAEPDADVVDLDGGDVGRGRLLRAGAAVTAVHRVSVLPEAARPAAVRLVAVVPEVEPLHLVGAGELARVDPDSDTSPTSST